MGRYYVLFSQVGAAEAEVTCFRIYVEGEAAFEPRSRADTVTLSHWSGRVERPLTRRAS